MNLFFLACPGGMDVWKKLGELHQGHATWFLGRTRNLVCPSWPALFVLPLLHKHVVHPLCTYVGSWAYARALRGYRRQPGRVGGPLIPGPGSCIRAPLGWMDTALERSRMLMLGPSIRREPTRQKKPLHTRRLPLAHAAR